MSHQEEYEQFMNDYRELQLRVTRFSTIEQQLINTRDQLDHELVLYKRLSLFNTEAFNSQSDEQFVQQIAEAIIDIFEIEASIVCVKNCHYPEKTRIHIEGFSTKCEQKQELLNQLIPFSERFIENQTNFVSQTDLATSACLSRYNEGLLFYFKNEETGYAAYLLGLISKENAPLYTPLQVRQETIFKVFVNQVQSHLENRLKSEKIQEQINVISKSEHELKKLSLIATKTKNSVIISDAEGRIEWVNDAFQTITGYSLVEVIGKKPKEFLQGPSTKKEEVERLSLALKKQENVETTLVNYRKNGQIYYNQLEITPVFDERHQLSNFISVQKDITEETTIQQEILKINSRYELIANKSNIGIWEWDPVNQSVVWNDVLFDIYGAQKTEVNSVLFDFWKSSIHPEDRLKVVTESNYLVENQEQILLENEYRIIRRNDQEIREVRCLTLAERDKNGSLLRLIGTATDVTGIKQYERAILSKNTELKKINTELDKFVYSVSHDLRSPLLSIKGLLSLVFSSDNLDESTHNYLKLAEKGVIRLDETIQEILEYSRNARLEVSYETFDLVALIQQIFNDLKFSTSEQFQFYLHTDLTTTITSDKSRFDILLKNLIGNAIKYQRLTIDNPYVSVEVSQKDKQSIQIRIEDNGEGIPEKHIHKIFDMFYRASSSSHGTGLGLYICKEIIAKLNATIDIQSKQNEGTTVYLSIPIQL